MNRYKHDHEFGGKLINNSKRAALMALTICRINPFGSNGKGTDTLEICMANEMLALRYGCVLCGVRLKMLPEDILWLTLFNLRYAELDLDLQEGNGDYKLIYWTTSVFRMFELYMACRSQGLASKIKDILMRYLPIRFDAGHP